jgi:hypothetical protein
MSFRKGTNKNLASLHIAHTTLHRVDCDNAGKKRKSTHLHVSKVSYITDPSFEVMLQLYNYKIS